MSLEISAYIYGQEIFERAPRTAFSMMLEQVNLHDLGFLHVIPTAQATKTNINKLHIAKI